MGKLNMNAAKKKADDLKRSGGMGADYDKLEKGKNVRRVLPPKGDNDVFWAEGYLHFQLGDDGKTTATCLETYGEGKKCPICQYVEQLKKSKRPEDKKLADQIKRTKRTYIAVLNRDAEEEKPLVLPVGQTIMKAIVDLICDPDYGDITDFEEGRDITITKTGSGLGTEYSVIAKPKTSICSEDYTPEELDELLPDLENIFIRRSAEELQAILDGEELSESDEEDNGNIDYDELELDGLEMLCKERGIKLPPKSTKLKLITLLERYDESESDEEEDEPKATKTNKGTKASKSKPQEDEEDDDDDDEDTSDHDEDDDEDELQKEMEKALKNRRSKK